MPIILKRPRIPSIFDEESDLDDWCGGWRQGQGLNIYEDEGNIVAEANLPGIPEDKIDVTVEDGIVRINGQIEEKEEDKGKRRYFVDTKAANYSYSFRVPEGVKAEPKAEFDNGLLTLTFAKVKATRPKAVKVKVARKK